MGRLAGGVIDKTGEEDEERYVQEDVILKHIYGYRVSGGKEAR